MNDEDTLDVCFKELLGDGYYGRPWPRSADVLWNEHRILQARVRELEAELLAWKHSASSETGLHQELEQAEARIRMLEAAREEPTCLK